MRPSHVLLACCSLAVLANALPRDQISFGFNDPYQAISKFLNELVPTESVPARLSTEKAGSDTRAGSRESQPAPFNLVLEPSLPCIGPWCKGQLHLIDTCNKNFFNRRTTVPVDDCYNIPQPFNPQGPVMVTKPAICPDGTYAKLAVYEGQGCRSMLVNTQLYENDTDLCLGTLRWRWGLKAPMTSLKPLCKDSPEYNISLAPKCKPQSLRRFNETDTERE